MHFSLNVPFACVKSLDAVRTRYFTPSAGSPLVKVAERIFQETLDRFELSHDVERRHDFVEAIRSEIRSLPAFQVLATFGGDDAAVTSYSQALQRQVFKPLNSGGQKRRLILDGQNPLTLLHRPLSQQLHGLTDEQCLQLATDIRIVLTALLENIADVLKDQDVLRAAVSRLKQS